jgi:ABC-type transporter Mla MlaB component
LEVTTVAVTLTEEFLEDTSELRLLLSGSLDAAGASLLMRRVADAFLADIRILVVDLSEVHALDHDGVNALVSLHAYAIAAGVAYELGHAPPLLYHVIRLASVDANQTTSWTTPVPSRR